jgi:hypothetical protein
MLFRGRPLFLFHTIRVNEFMRLSELSDEELGALLARQYRRLHDLTDAERGEDCPHPSTTYNIAQRALRNARAAERGEPVESGRGASDAAVVKGRPWSKATLVVRQALDAGFDSRRSASAALAVSRAALRHAGYSENDSRFRELEAYAALADGPVGDSATIISGYGRLKG